MPYSINILRLLEKLEPSTREVLMAVLEEIERQREATVTKKEFNELKDIVKELAEAHKKSEERLTRLEQTVAELAEAQKKTEQRLNELAEAQKKTEQRLKELAEAHKKSEERLTRLEQTVAELAEAQKKTEQRLNELAEAQKKTEQRLNELAEAQKKTEQRLNELAEAQKKTEQRLNELAEAQKKTETELKKLIGEHRKTREQLGGLAHTVGYVLEDRAFIGLPPLLEKEFGLKLLTPLKRDFIETSPGRYVEVNIIGKAVKDTQPILIVGECKTQLKKRDVDNFLKNLAIIKEALNQDIFPILVTYQAPPQVQNYVRQKGLKLFLSYQFPIYH